MSIVSAIVLFAVVWFLVLFVVLPFRLKTQGDVGDVMPGTQAGAPETAFSMKRKAGITTVFAVAVWGLLVCIILFSGLSIRDFDLYSRFGPGSVTAPEASETGG